MVLGAQQPGAAADAVGFDSASDRNGIQISPGDRRQSGSLHPDHRGQSRSSLRCTSCWQTTTECYVPGCEMADAARQAPRPLRPPGGRAGTAGGYLGPAIYWLATPKRRLYHTSIPGGGQRLMRQMRLSDPHSSPPPTPFPLLPHHPSINSPSTWSSAQASRRLGQMQSQRALGPAPAAASHRAPDDISFAFGYNGPLLLGRSYIMHADNCIIG